MAAGDINHDRAWRLALVAGNENAMRVLAAWYSIPRRRRRTSMPLVSELSGVPRVHSILKRLEVAGLIAESDNPPQVAETMLNMFTKGLIAPTPRSR